MMMTVTRIVRMFMMKVKRRYLAIRGSTREVGGCNTHINISITITIFINIIINIIIIVVNVCMIVATITKIFETRSRNTTSERRIEMPNVTFSPACTLSLSFFFVSF